MHLSLEENEVYVKIGDKLNESELSEREQEVARILYSKGVLDKIESEDNDYYKPAKEF